MARAFRSVLQHAAHVARASLHREEMKEERQWGDRGDYLIIGRFSLKPDMVDPKRHGILKIRMY